MTTLLLKPIRSGINLIIRPQDRAIWLPEVTKDSAAVDIYVGSAEAEVGDANFLGTAAPGSSLVVDFNPDLDRNLRLYGIARAADGSPDVSNLKDAVRTDFSMNRITEAPEINQATDAQHTEATVGVTAQRFARRLQVQTASDTGFTTDLTDDEQDIADYRVAVPITRTSPGTGTLTIYVRSRASGGGGQFGPWSATQTVTFANDLGSGGSGGSGGFPPGSILPVEHAE